MEGNKSAVSLTPEQTMGSVNRFLQNVGAWDPKELADELFRDNGEFSGQLVEALPRLINAATEIMKRFVESLESMPTEESTELLASSFSRIDSTEIGEVVNSLVRVVIQLHEQDPELYPQNKVAMVSEIVNTVDSGKLRKALIYRSDERARILADEIKMMLKEEPISTINLAAVVTSVVNNHIDVANESLKLLDLPVEAMAYILLHIFEDIEWETLAETINGVAELIINLHRGNYIRGDGVLESREVFDRIGERLITNLDPQSMAEALQAIGEEFEAAITPLVNVALENEELVVWMTGGLATFVNSYIKVIANILEKANTLPSQTVERIADVIAEDFEAKELGRALNNLVALAGRLGSEKPELFDTLYQGALAGANLQDRLRPAAIGAGVNRALASYNSSSRKGPGPIEKSLDEFTSTVDAQQLSEAAHTAASRVVEFTSRHPEVARALFGAVISVASKTVWENIKERIKNLWSTKKRPAGAM